jgi:hypothetical protein
MPTLQQTATTLRGAVNHLQVQSVKPGSTRATIGMDELGNSAGQVFNHLSDQKAQERLDVARIAILTDEALKAATVDAKAAKDAIKSADGKKAAASATLEAAKAEARLTVAKAAAEAAAAHAKAAAPVDELEDKAAAVQAQAEAARDAADTLRAEGDDHVADAQETADADIEEAKQAYDLRMTEIENEVRKSLGV